MSESRATSSRNAWATSSESAGEVVAAAVGAPDRVLIGTRQLPSDIVPTRRLLRPDRRPGAKLSRNNRRPGVFELGTRGRAVRVKEIVAVNLNQTRCASGLDQRVRPCSGDIHRRGRSPEVVGCMAIINNPSNRSG